MAGDNREERQARSLALERAYVHDVYDRIAHHFADTRYRPWPRVRQFLEELEPGSIVADIGCGNGKYLDINPDVMKIGSDHCASLTAAARSRGHEVTTCDNLRLPFRDESFDAVLSVAVIHHFATTERRVAAIQELTRVLRIGGRLLITVWAVEQRHRKFDSQDVLVPWHEPVKSSSEERELTSTTTSDDDVLVYHAYSHISDGEGQQQTTTAHAKRKLKYRNGRGRYRSADHPCASSSQSSSELSSPNETCYSFVRRAFQKLSTSTAGPYDPFAKKTNTTRPYFYRSCRKPCISDSMDFSKDSRTTSPRNEFQQQDSIESEYPDQENEDNIPIEIRHLEGYDTCQNCGSPEFGNYEGGNHVCASCLPAADSDNKKSRSLGDFLNMIPRLLRVKKCEKEPLSDLHKRISTASDPREYVVKSRGANVNGIVRSKSTVSFMSRLEELMSMSMSGGKEEQETVANPNCPAGPRTKAKPSRLPSLTSSVLVEGNNGTISVLESSDVSTNPRRHISPADALRKLRQEMSMDESRGSDLDDEGGTEKKMQNSEAPSLNGEKKTVGPCAPDSQQDAAKEEEATTRRAEPEQNQAENGSLEAHLSSYYSMPELYKLADDQIPEDSIFNPQRQKTISFLEHAQNILADSSTTSTELNSRADNSALHYEARERTCISLPQRGLVKRSLSVDTGDNSSACHQVPRRFSASAAQGVLASALRTYTLPRSCSRGSSVKSDTSVDSEESIVSVIPRKGNSITSDTSVDSEESVISVIQRSTSDIDTLGNQNGIRNISRFGSRSAQASPVTVLSGQTSSAESSPPQSGKNDGRFPGNAGVIDQLLQQQQNALLSASDSGTFTASDHGVKARKFLLRPITDPRLEERFSSQSSEDSLSSPHVPKLPSLEESRPLRSSFQTGTIEKSEQTIKESKALTKTSLDGLDNSKEEQKDNADGELSRTPSPVGPICYIIDPLITGIELPQGVACNDAINGGEEIESKTKCLRFDSEVTSIEKMKTSPNSALHKTSLENLPSVLKNFAKKDALEKTNSTEASHLENPNISKSPAEMAKETKSQENGEENCNDNKGLDSDVRRSLFNLRERLESLTSSQSSIQGFDIFKNVSHTIQGMGSLKNIKERLESETDLIKDTKVSPTPKSLNDSRQSSLDESSLVTLSDESVMSVEGTSSVSDEANDFKRTGDDDDDDDIDSSQNITIRKAVEADKCLPGTSKAQHLNVLTDAENGPIHKPSKPPSLSDTELHLRKGSVRCALRKRLRRSCVTIDEADGRDFISSEDTSPSSSVSLEWNDFDKMETDSSSGAVCCSSITTATTASDIQRDEPSIEICCDDVNVAETETKLNVFGDKEMCVFFETPPSSSSMGKSASSSSNATDFSTTSDRIRGVMQREKSDDRSSKESDSDNLSKLSDIEAKSDSAFSEDFARRTDVASSSSSISLDVLDSLRVKLSGESELEISATRAKQTSNWVLENIDEIPDDEMSRVERGDEKSSPTPSTSWSSSMDFAQKRDNFLGCAADCRDMYRISFDDKSRTAKECDTGSSTKILSAAPEPNCSSEFVSPESCSSNKLDSGPQTSEAACSSRHNSVPSTEVANCSSKLNGPVGMRVPELAPDVLGLFPRKAQGDNEGHTDILAAFVETISDLTAVFQELYPRQENKFEDASSDESVEISAFERILTSSDPPSTKSNQNISVEHKAVEKDEEDRADKKKEGQPRTNGKVSEIPNPKSSQSLRAECDTRETFVKLPPESDAAKPKACSSRGPVEKRKSLDLGTRNIPAAEKRFVSDPAKLSNLRTTHERTLKSLNRSSQSVRQESMEREDESTMSTHSAPCSPRMKPRQRSLEEVMSSSRTELSRTSSLSQSTSQESLPGNETGGLMACHRYYHVFRQGELDSLIENHVDNLHIISSYYDHANWCVVAEKVQVWTI